MPAGYLDHELTRQMASLIEELTTSGNPSLDQETTKKLKRICRTSDLYVEHAFHQLMTQLEREHAEIRLSTLQIIDELFNRSHAFRELLVSDFQKFLELTVETDQDQPLPPPRAVAQKLKADTLKAVQHWHEKYATGYKKLALGYNYLKTCKHVDFNDIRARSIAERQQQEEQEMRKQKALQAKLEKARKEISEMKGEMDSTVTESENCIDLLLPRPETFLFSESDFFTSNTDLPSKTSTNTASTKSSQHRRVDSVLLADQKHKKDAKQDKVIGTVNFNVSVSKHDDINSKDILSSEVQHKCDKSSFKDKISSDLDCKLSCKSAVHDALSKVSGVKQISMSDEDRKQQIDDKQLDNKTNPLLHKATGALNSTSVCTHKGANVETPEVDDNSDSDDSFEDVAEEDDEKRMVKAHGLGSRKYQLEIEIGTNGVSLAETKDNRDLYHNLKDANCLISLRYLPQVIKWLEVLGKAGGSQAEIKTMIDLKLRLEHVQSKCTELHLVPDPNDELTKGKESDTDDDLEEVPEKEGYEPHIPSHMRAEYGLTATSSQPRPSTSGTQGKVKKSSKPEKKREKPDRRGSKGDSQKATSAFWSLAERNKSALAQDPTSRAANLVKLGLSEDCASKTGSQKGKPATVTSETLTEVPTLLFGTDLAYWGNADKIEAPTVVKNDSLHRFWVPAQVEHEKPSQHDVAAVMNRTFHYVGDFVPVKWKCRAKLPNGKLCERMDRLKCPFHGKIIARDLNGDPSNPEDVKMEIKKEKQEPAPSVSSESGEVPPWLDAELQADIEAATGHDLGSRRSKAKANKDSKGKSKGKAKRKKYPGLTDIKEVKNTSRSRLESKVFNRGSLKRVATRLDAADYKRARDKFANQFNYAYKT